MMKFITQPFKQVSTMIAQSSNALSYIIIGIFITLGPIFFFPVRGLSITASKGFFVAYCAIFGLLVAGITILKRGTITFPRHGVFFILGGLSITTLLSAIFSQSPTMGILGYGFETTTWLFVTIFALFVLLAYKTIKSYDRIGIIYGGLFLAFIIIAIHQLIRFFAGPATANLWVLASNTSTLVGSWSDLGMFAGVVLLIAIVTLQLAGLVRFAKWITVTIATIAGVFLLVMNMNTVWIVLGLMSLLLTLYLFAFAYWDSSSKTYKKEKRVPWYVLALFLVSLAAIFFGGMVNGLVSNYRNITWNEVRPSLKTTVSVAQKSFGHNFVAGYGPNSFALGWSLAKPPVLSGNSLSDADFALGYSYVTSQIAMNGVLGAIFWVVFFLVILIAVLKRLGKGFEHALDRYFVISITMTILFLGIMSMVAVPGSYILTLFAVLVGAFYGTFVPKTDRTISFIKDPRASFFGILAITLVIIGTLIGGYIITRKLVSFFHDTKGLILMTNQKYKEAADEISLATAYASHDLYHIQLAQLALGDAGKIIAGITESNRQQISSQAEQVLGIALGHAKAATLQNSFNYKNWVLLGNVYRAAVSLGVKDAYKLAIEAYNQAEKRNPSDATMKLAYANLALANRDSTAALQSIKDSIDLFPTRDAYLLRAQIQITQQRWSDVVTSLKQATLLDQKNPVLYVYLGVAYEKSGDMDNANKIYDLIRKQFADGDQVISQIKTAFNQNMTVTQSDTNSPTIQTGKKAPVAPKPKK